MTVPVILITGFLGAGKTTFINWLIKHHPDRKISLILNEFGDVPLESQFIDDKGIQVAELKSGCLCCVARVDIPRVVRYVIEHSPQTEYLVIEASGLSDPAPVYASLTGPDLVDIIKLDSNLCIVDALNFATTRQKFPIVMSQVGDADMILISKGSEAGSEKVAALKQMLTNNIGTIRILEMNDTLSPQLFLNPEISLNPKAQIPNLEAHDHSHESFTDLFFKSDKPVNVDKFSTLIHTLPPDIIRAKGVINSGTQKLLFQLVGNRSELLESSWSPDEPHLTALLFFRYRLRQSRPRTTVKFLSCLKKSFVKILTTLASK